MAAYAARTTKLCSHAYAEISTKAKLSLAVEHFIAGLANLILREYLHSERAQRTLELHKTVRIAQTSEAARLSNFAPTAAAASAVYDPRSLSTSLVPRDQSNFAHLSARN